MDRTPSRSLLLACTLLASATASELAAQGVTGRLVDDATGGPIPSATVTLLGVDGGALRGVVTDADGGFRFEPGTGRFRLRAERIGYRTAESPMLDLWRGDEIEVELRMSTEAVLLAPLTVTASSRGRIRNRNLDGFYSRRDRGRGRFFRPEDVERIRPVYVANLLQITPGVELEYRSMRPEVWMRQGIRRCMPTLYIDGHPIPLYPGFSIDDWVIGSSVRALEVYRNAHEVPIDLPSFSGCGAVVVWTEFGVGLAGGPAVPQSRRGLALVAWIAVAASTLLLASQ
jgi:hypothetical protein